jgi:hypothetical protein
MLTGSVLQDDEDIDAKDRVELAALDALGAFRRIAKRVRQAGNNPQRQQEALAVAQRIATTHASILRLALGGE